MSEARYLLIGAGGLVGSHLLRQLQGRDVIPTYRDSSPHGGELLDVTDGEGVRRVVETVKPSIVLLAAAEPHVERCEREPAATRATNVEGTRSVARAAGDVGAKLVVFSSEYVFDGTRGEYGEQDQVAPVNEYGRQKVEIEEIARTGDHLICRTSGVFGAHRGRKNFVLQLVDAARAERRFKVPADQTITPTDARSLAAAVVEVLDQDLSGTFHVAGPERMLRPAFAARVAQAFQLANDLIDEVPTRSMGLTAQRPLHAGLRDDKLREALGHGLTPVDEALRRLAAEDSP